MNISYFHLLNIDDFDDFYAVNKIKLRFRVERVKTSKHPPGCATS